MVGAEQRRVYTEVYFLHIINVFKNKRNASSQYSVTLHHLLVRHAPQRVIAVIEMDCIMKQAQILNSVDFEGLRPAISDQWRTKQEKQPGSAKLGFHVNFVQYIWKGLIALIP